MSCLTRASKETPVLVKVAIGFLGLLASIIVGVIVYGFITDPIDMAILFGVIMGLFSLLWASTTVADWWYND